MQQSIERSYQRPGKVNRLQMKAEDVAMAVDSLDRLGLFFPAQLVRQMMQYACDKVSEGKGHLALDALEPTVTTANIGTPLQFLQNWLVGFVYVITQARKADELMGLTTSGDWSDEEIVQGVMEQTGFATPYGDYTNVPFSNWNTNFVQRTVVRWEEGMKIGPLDEDRAARMNVNSAQSKREAAALSLEIARNDTAFYGYNGGNNRTYGFLNEPGLGAYTNAPNGSWATATYLQIQQDILTMIADVRSQSGDNIDPKEVDMILAVASDVVDFLSTPPVYGDGSVNKWLADNYPRITVKSAPELNAANGGQNVAYLYAVEVGDNSTDNGRVWDQVVPAKFRMLGVDQKTKGYEEDYTNATAGALCKRPWAVVRYTNF